MSYYYYWPSAEEANKLELHYFFGDESHSIDAFIRHKCETEILTIAKDLIIAFGGDINILSEIPAEGGYRDFWKFVKKHSAEIGLSLTFIGIIVQIVIATLSKVPSDTQELQKRALILDTTEKVLNIEKLKRELQEGKPVKDIINECIDSVNENYKFIKHKSNFYQTLQSYGNVSKISTTSYLDDKAIGEANIVEKADFHKFILTTNTLPTITVEKAVIEIISPVLKNEKYKWRGIYEGKAISFNMKDEAYKTSVVKGATTFHSGFYIECVLKIGREINDVGIVEHNDYSIVTVTGQIEDGKIIETEQGKRYKRNKKDLDNQTNLFD